METNGAGITESLKPVDSADTVLKKKTTLKGPARRIATAATLAVASAAVAFVADKEATPAYAQTATPTRVETSTATPPPTAVPELVAAATAYAKENGRPSGGATVTPDAAATSKEATKVKASPTTRRPNPITPNPTASLPIVSPGPQNPNSNPIDNIPWWVKLAAIPVVGVVARAAYSRFKGKPPAFGGPTTPRTPTGPNP